MGKRISTWIMVGMLILLTLAAAIIIKVNVKHDNSNSWKQDLAQQNISMERQLNNLPTASSREQVRNQIEVNKYRIAHDMAPNSNHSLWGFAEGAASMISIIALFAIILGGGIVANEFSSGTIKLLLIRPHRRWKILLSKYISVLSYVVLMLVILFVTSFILGGLFFSFKGAASPFLKYADGNVVKVNMLVHMAQTYGLECVSLIIYTTFAFMISTVFRSSSLAIGISIFLMFMGSVVVQLLSNFSWTKYILFANTNLKQYLSGNTPPVKGMTMSFSVTMLIIYFLVFNVISFVLFKKRDVAA